MTERNDNPYDPVSHSHVVPTGYLRAWTHGKQIGMCLVDGSEAKEISVRNAGVLKNFYKRQRPGTGETIYDVERSLQDTETVALPIIADLPARWPLDLDDKNKVGQFFALQHLRGMAFRRLFEDHIASVLDLVRADPEGTLEPHPGRTTTEVIEELETGITSDTYRLMRMLKIVRSVGVVFTSMHWSLVEFDKGGLVTSDHPVVVWPIGGAAGRRPSANDPAVGVLETFEVFVPVAPTHLLLMTWRVEKSIGTPVVGQGRHLATANAFVVANADTQWFHEPGVNLRTTRGHRPPLAAELLDGYGLSEAQGSDRRATARTFASVEMRRELGNDPVQVVSEDRLPSPT